MGERDQPGHVVVESIDRAGDGRRRRVDLVGHAGHEQTEAGHALAGDELGLGLAQFAQGDELFGCSLRVIKREKNDNDRSTMPCKIVHATDTFKNYNNRTVIANCSVRNKLGVLCQVDCVTTIDNDVLRLPRNWLQGSLCMIYDSEIELRNKNNSESVNLLDLLSQNDTDSEVSERTHDTPKVRTSDTMFEDLLQHIKCSRKVKASQEERDQLVELLQACDKAFAKNPTDLGKAAGVTHKIKLVTEEPCREGMRKYNPLHRQEASRQIRELLELGMIEPSFSESHTDFD